MESTVHGTERIFGRTKMMVGDVLLLLSNGVSVELGSDGEYKFLLFYSPPDKKTKIAVVTEDRAHLISVWETSFALPPGIQEPTPELDYEAKVHYFNFWRDRVGSTANPIGATWNGVIDVLVDQEVVYKCEAGSIPEILGKDLVFAVKFLGSQVKRIADIVSAHRENIGGRIYYRLQFSSESGLEKEFVIKHEKILKHLAAA